MKQIKAIVLALLLTLGVFVQTTAQNPATHLPTDARAINAARVSSLSPVTT
jgi:hypothetical protein